MNVDTLSIARDLRATELPVAQAEAIAAAIGRSVSEGAASKTDLDLMRTDLKSDFSLLRIELEKLRTEIEKSRNQTIIWLIGAVLAVGGTIIAFIKL